MENMLMNVMNTENCETVYAVAVKTKEEKIEMFNAVSNPSFLMSDCINQKIAIKNISITPVDIVNENGEIIKLPRTVILSKDGNSYTATSIGIYNSIKSIYSIFKEELLAGEITVCVKQKTTRKGNKTMILEVV